MLATTPAGTQNEGADDQVVALRGATWADYLRLQRIRGEAAVPRLALLDGQVELLAPGRAHEAERSTLASLMESWCFHVGIEFRSLGCWTQADEASACGADPDGCWILGVPTAPRPHLVLLVERMLPAVDKLEVFCRLGVPEVWVWRKGRISAWILRGDEYVQAPRSEALPGIDLGELASFVDRPMTSQSVREYRAALEARAAR